MANDVLKLTWAADGEADEATLNLLDFIQGLTLAENGWTPQIATVDQSIVTETFTFYAKGTSHDDLAARVTQLLDDWKIKIGWSMDYTQRQFVWLNARWKSETNIRRAVVYSLDYSFGNQSSPFGVYVRDDSFAPALTIVIRRGAYWEDTAITSLSHLLAINTLGGTKFFTAGGGLYTAIGDVPARISRIQVSIGGGVNLQYFWMGWRASRNGILNNFIPLWELELASALSTDTTVVADATAHGGSKLVTDFSLGTTLSARAGMNALDTLGSPQDQRGSFICLLRAKMSDASIARVRASSGFVYAGIRDSAYIVNPRKVVSGTSWNIYNLGVVRLPAINREYTNSNLMDQASICIDAERVSGSGNLEMDCLVLVPYNDAYVEADSGNSVNVQIMNNPDMTFTAFANPGIKSTGVSSNGWSVPANNEPPLFVLCAARASSHVLTDAVTVVMRVVHRWRTLRGVE